MAGAEQRAALPRHSGKTWTGGVDVLAPEIGVDGDRTVRARSAAEMPVVTPSRASMETVKAVWCRVP